MMQDDLVLTPGQRVIYAEFGDGVIIEPTRDGYARVFFPVGERQVPITAIRVGLSPSEQILSGVAGTPERVRQAWLCYEARALPLMESSPALTAAKIDLLPHQVVLTHRVATASPRRFLIADEVGLGKTIETALLLRELASRSELHRALIVVPAGLVNNWHRELNEVFHLNFEVFGSEGDVTDRKSNAFAKHDRLIASIDTLKRRARVRRLREAPAWDLVVFDEAHHLTAARSGNKIRRTENYKLAEVLKSHARDLLLLSATPHQGDHFRFWMLVQLLNPTLFSSPEDMIENRHRLNTVVFRRTKADACRSDGSPLFARRWVHTESFVMSDAERRFYEELLRYLQDGFALAQRQGNQGRALGFVMTIFQKIAASSFAAVRRTLRRRLLMLTLHEAILQDRELNIDNRERLHDEAKSLIQEELGLGDDPVSQSQIERMLADLKFRVVKRLDDEKLALTADPYGTEYASANAEEAAASAVSLALPQERFRIRELLDVYPDVRETKVGKLVDALGTLWRQNPDEKVVVFATYLGTVDLLGREIEHSHPGQGVVVLRGGDHGSKLAAERRFRHKDGPRVLVCTAAGREGINLQFARILFNFDLPWNPMDIEQRIGRIHRYGQNYTAQVYNLVLSDTIEGRIFLLLNDKLLEIAKTLGKVDEDDNIAEDLRSQVLGQLSERLSYDRLYQQALSDPQLRRTRLELEAALSNATEARKVVFDLFQDLEGFSLDDYTPFADVTQSIDRLIQFLTLAAEVENQRMVRIGEDRYDLRSQDGQTAVRFTSNRAQAREHQDLDILGLDHPVVNAALHRWAEVSSHEVGVAVEGNGKGQGVLSWWLVESRGTEGEQRTRLQALAVSCNGTRLPVFERLGGALLHHRPAVPFIELNERLRILKEYLEPMLYRELQQSGFVNSDGGFSARLVGWVEVRG